jgi:hypothetical protein
MKPGRLAFLQFLLAAVASIGSVFFANVSEVGKDGVGVFLAYWQGLGILDFFFVMPIILAIGYLGEHRWTRTAHFVKAGGCAYGALSIVVPLFFGGISVYWPLVLALVFTVVIDAFSLANG